jgi:methylaspartate mutase epsilon subunit
MKMIHKNWTDEEFLNMRKEVLSQWPTGREVDLEEALEYQKKLPKHKVSPHVLSRAKKEGRSLISPQIGRAPIEETADFIEYLEAHSGPCGGWLVYGDAYTRKNRFELAQTGIERSIREGMSMLNGYPIVNYGVKETRRLVEISQSPLWLVGCDEDPRLQSEIACASGFTDIGSESLQDLIAHSKDYSFEQRIINSQYMNWLMAYYTQHGAPINARCTAYLSGWDMPSFKVVVVILQTMLAASQGCKYIGGSIGLGQNMLQDVAALRGMRRLMEEYNSKLGYSDISYSTGVFPWLGAWPREPDRTAAMIAWNTVIGVMGNADFIFIKCADEAHATPTKEGMTGAVILAHQLVQTMGNQSLTQSKELEIEEEMIEKEARATVDKVIDLGDGDVAIGMVKAVECGVLDTIFSPWRYLKGNVLLVRDNNGAIRYLDHGNIPLPTEVVEYNREKVAEREKVEGVKADLEMVIKDVTYCSVPLTSSAKTVD